MRKLFYMGLESYEARYTLQLQDWNEREFQKHGIDYEITQAKNLITARQLLQVVC